MRTVSSASAAAGACTLLCVRASDADLSAFFRPIQVQNDSADDGKQEQDDQDVYQNRTHTFISEQPLPLACCPLVHILPSVCDWYS